MNGPYHQLIWILPPFLEKKKAEDKFLSLFEAEKCVLQSHMSPEFTSRVMV